MQDITNQWFELYATNQFQAIVFVLIPALFIGIIVILFCEPKIRAYRRRVKEQQALELAKKEAQVHIDALPRLDTTHLLVINKEMKPARARTFGTRYDGIVINDEWGRCWIGLVTPDLMDNLISAEFVCQDLWVPFCGPGEMYRAEIKEVNGRKYNYYPQYLTIFSPSSAEWQWWDRICQNYEAVPRLRSRYFTEVPYETRQKWENRNRYELVPQA